MFAPLTKTIQVGQEAPPSSMAWDTDTFINYINYDPEYEPEPWSFEVDNNLVYGAVDVQGTSTITPTKWYFEVEQYYSTEYAWFPSDLLSGIASGAIDNPDNYYCIAFIQRGPPTWDGKECFVIQKDTSSLECSLDGGDTPYVVFNGSELPYEWDYTTHVVYQFAGDQTNAGSGNGKIWMGVNGQWLSVYRPEEWIWNEETEEDEYIPAYWEDQDPENGTNPAFDNLGENFYPVCYCSDSSEGINQRYQRLRSDPADFLYTPPAGFSGLSSSATSLTLDPNEKTATCIVSNGNLTVTGDNASALDQIRSISVVGNDQWYAEVEVGALPNGIVLGVATGDFDITDPFKVGGLHWILHGRTIYPSNAIWFANVDAVSTYRMAFRDGQLWFGTDVHGWRGDPVVGTTPAFSGIPTPLYIVLGVAENAEATFVPSDFSFSPPTGFTQPTLGSLITLSVLRDLVIQPIVKPTQHHWIGYSGL